MTELAARSRARATSRRRLAIRILLGLAAAALLLLAVLTVVLFVLTSRAPAWWAPPDPADPAAKDTAQAVENGITTILHQAHASGAGANGSGASEPWTVRLTDDEINAWLSVRLGSWLASRSDVSAADIPLVQVAAAADGLRIGIGLGRSRVLSAVLAPEIAADGSLRVRAGDCAIGELAVPLSWIGRIARQVQAGASGTGDFDADALLEALAGRRAAAADPVLTLSDGRRVRLLGLRLGEGELLVTCRTLER
jgi:hypothetical protein